MITRTCTRLVIAAALLFVPAWSGTVPAQLRPRTVAELPGEVSLRLMLRKLGSAATFMQATAHPDDEDNALLAMLGHGQGMRTVLVSATRGEGGQNEIGPELFQALGVLRTEELLAVHRFDGAEQYFTRASDFGFSFSIEETFDKWGHDAILGDYVRHIRAVRPDVIVGFLCGGQGGGQHHQAAARLTAEAFTAAADPSKYPDQFKEGLRPWQAQRVFCTDTSSFGSRAAAPRRDVLTVNTSGFDSLLGRTYAELGLEARSMHKCQGTSQLLLLPGQGDGRTYRLVNTASGAHDVAPASLFEGIDPTLAGLTRFAPALAGTLDPALADITRHVASAKTAVDAGGPAAAAPPLASGLAAVRALRARLRPSTDAGAYEVDFRLAQKEAQFEDALLLAANARLEALAADGLVIQGQHVPVTAYASNHLAAPMVVRAVRFAGAGANSPACSGSVAPGRALECKGTVDIPGDAPFTSPYWHLRTDAARYDFAPGVPFGVPFTPTPFTATFDLTIAGADVSAVRPIQYRYDNLVAGEKRMELQVVPPFAVTVTPEIAVVPAGSGARRRIDVAVTNQMATPGRAAVSLQVPDGWTTEPASAPAAFAREDEQVTVSFALVPPKQARAGEYHVGAVVQEDGTSAARSSVGYQVVEYPHIHRRHLVEAAETRVKVIDVRVAPGLRIGYIMGVGDQVPAAIEQLGADVHLITPAELAAGDLSQYDAIVTGVRAYERRPDLRAYNHRLLAYAENGGTVLVQYNKFEFNQAQYGPYPAKVSSNRVTDENAPVEVLLPDHPVFNSPNRIGPDAWRGWVQERGLYFLGERDPRYVDLVRLQDPFPFNAGPKTGALVEAKVGKGRWIYIGLGLWRQLPAGTDGAYQLMANLISLGADR